jgi:hypothetical protein
MSSRTFYAGCVGDLDVSSMDARVRIEDLRRRFDMLALSPEDADALSDLLKTAAQAARAQTSPAGRRR